jgi:hypothetical protein
MKWTLYVSPQKSQGGNKGHAKDGAKYVPILQGPPLGLSGVSATFAEDFDAKGCLHLAGNFYMEMVCTRVIPLNHHCSWCGPAEFLRVAASNAYTHQKY